AEDAELFCGLVGCAMRIIRQEAQLADWRARRTLRITNNGTAEAQGFYSIIAPIHLTPTTA
ncbi:MAG: hypothetical protein WBO93_16105, partial [Gammaproteobacteria bacterium]